METNNKLLIQEWITNKMLPYIKGEKKYGFIEAAGCRYNPLKKYYPNEGQCFYGEDMVEYHPVENHSVETILGNHPNIFPIGWPGHLVDFTNIHDDIQAIHDCAAVGNYQKAMKNVNKVENTLNIDLSKVKNALVLIG